MQALRPGQCVVMSDTMRLPLLQNCHAAASQRSLRCFQQHRCYQSPLVPGRTQQLQIGLRLSRSLRTCRAALMMRTPWRLPALQLHPLLASSAWSQFHQSGC